MRDDCPGLIADNGERFEYAVRIRYMPYGDGKWRTHTTKWHGDPNAAWEEAERYPESNKAWEAKSGLIWRKAK